MDVKTAPKVKNIIGLIYSPQSDIARCISHLQNIFGDYDLISREFEFNMTDYYEEEMGKDLKRKFISFKKLIEPQHLPEIKRLTNIVELHYGDIEQRQVNLDPGYMDMDKFVLASAKYGRQKIYMDKGIYADPTLYFYKKAYHAYEWSFPDFKDGKYLEYFISVRNLYKEQIREL